MARDSVKFDSVLMDAYLRIGIAATEVGRLSVDVPSAEIILKWGRLSIGAYSVGTSGVTPTADDWERLVQMLIAGGADSR